jgi:hypothetical protein
MARTFPANDGIPFLSARGMRKAHAEHAGDAAKHPPPAISGDGRMSPHRDHAGIGTHRFSSPDQRLVPSIV